MVSVDRSLLKRVALKFSADFVHLLSSERLFKIQRHLIEDDGYDELIPITVHTSGSGLFLTSSDILIPLTHRLEKGSNGVMNLLK